MFLFKFWPKKASLSKCDGPEREGQLNLSGLSCGGCVSKLSQALEDKGIPFEKISTTELVVDAGQVGEAATVVEACGFKVVENEPSKGCCS